MAVFLENDLDVRAIIERQLEQELEQDLNSRANAVSPIIQGSPEPSDATPVCETRDILTMH
jgi:hypothetical protein